MGAPIISIQKYGNRLNRTKDKKKTNGSEGLWVVSPTKKRRIMGSLSWKGWDFGVEPVWCPHILPLSPTPQKKFLTLFDICSISSSPLRPCQLFSVPLICHLSTKCILFRFCPSPPPPPGPYSHVLILFSPFVFFFFWGWIINHSFLLLSRMFTKFVNTFDLV